MLQQLLYYNLCWSAAWIIAVGVRVYIKVRKQAAQQQLLQAYVWTSL
jgi:hypothetical protein